MATEVAYKNGYDKAVQELREHTKLAKIDDEKYQCEKCKAINNRLTKFCPDCGRVVDY